MALGWGQSSDLWSPLAVTVIGGLFSSTFLTLFILPDFILIAEEQGVRFKAWSKTMKARMAHGLQLLFKLRLDAET